MNSVGKISIAAVVALSVGGGIVAASANTERDAGPTADAIVGAAAEQGQQTSLTPVQERSLGTAETNGFRPQRERAVEVGPEGDRWTLVPTAEGGVCQLSAGGILGCSTPESVVAGKASLTLTAPPANDAELAKERLAAIKAQAAERRDAGVRSGEIAGPGIPLDSGDVGTTVIRGLAPGGASSVEAVGRAGAVASTARVTDGVYKLTVTDGEPAALRFRAPDGKSVVATASR